MTVALWILVTFAGAVLATLGALITTALWKALGEVARLPAAVDALRDAVDALATTVPHRLDRLEAAVFPEGIPA